jgi:hypothetical protein
MPARSREAWNDEDIATLRRMSAAGEGLPAIARELERTQAAVRARAGMLKLTTRADPSPRQYR